MVSSAGGMGAEVVSNRAALEAYLSQAPELHVKLAPLLVEIEPALPRRFHAHMSPSLAESLRPRRRVVSHGRFLKLALRGPERLAAVDVADVESLGPSNDREVRARTAARASPPRRPPACASASSPRQTSSA